MENFENRVAVITGGNSGIGYYTAKALAQKGARVIITGRRKEAVEQAARELNVQGITADQAVLADTDKLVKEIAETYGKVDVLLINAGISRLAPIAATTEDMFNEVMDVNFKGAYFTLSKFIPILQEQASVIFISSTSASISPVTASVYAASKAAINAVVKIAALELAPQHIRVNAISPGPVATPIMNKIGADEAVTEQMRQSIPLARLGEPGEVAGLVTYLAGSSASFITGANFLVDGGQSI